MSGLKTPLADAALRARYGLPDDFDIDSVPIAHLQDLGARFRREAERKAEAAEAERKKQVALQPPPIIPQFIATASHLKGDRRIAGISSTGAINSHNYVLCPGGADIVLPVPLLINHDPQKCIGSIEGAEITSEGQIRISANLDWRCDARTWRRIQSRELGCFSGAADDKTLCAPVNLHGVNHYFSWRLKEVSLCETGANHECTVTEIWPPIADARSPELAGAEAMGKFESFGQLQARIAALESRPATFYRGIWSGSETYEAGEQTTHQGSLWTCRESTRSRPGEDGTWRLTVKRGRA